VSYQSAGGKASCSDVTLTVWFVKRLDAFAIKLDTNL